MLFIILFNAELKFASEQIYFIFVHIDYGRSEQACLWIMNKIANIISENEDACPRITKKMLRT